MVGKLKMDFGEVPLLAELYEWPEREVRQECGHGTSEGTAAHLQGSGVGGEGQGQAPLSSFADWKLPRITHARNLLVATQFCSCMGVSGRCLEGSLGWCWVWCALLSPASHKASRVWKPVAPLRESLNALVCHADSKSRCGLHFFWQRICISDSLPPELRPLFVQHTLSRVGVETLFLPLLPSGPGLTLGHTKMECWHWAVPGVELRPGAPGKPRRRPVPGPLGLQGLSQPHSLSRFLGVGRRDDREGRGEQGLEDSPFPCALGEKPCAQFRASSTQGTGTQKGKHLAQKAKTRLAVGSPGLPAVDAALVHTAHLSAAWGPCMPQQQGCVDPAGAETWAPAPA